MQESLKNLYNGVSINDVRYPAVNDSTHPGRKKLNYSLVTARLLLDSQRSEALSFLGIAETATQHDMESLYAKAFPAFIKRGVELELLDPVLKAFNLARLGEAFKAERDKNQFNYLGLTNTV